MIYIYHEIHPEKPHNGLGRFLFFVRDRLGIFVRYVLGFLVAAFVLFLFAFVLLFALAVLAATFVFHAFRDLFGTSPVRKRVSKGDVIDGEFVVISRKETGGKK